MPPKTLVGQQLGVRDCGPKLAGDHARISRSEYHATAARAYQLGHVPGIANQHRSSLRERFENHHRHSLCPGRKHQEVGVCDLGANSDSIQLADECNSTVPYEIRCGCHHGCSGGLAVIAGPAHET